MNTNTDTTNNSIKDNIHIGRYIFKLNISDSKFVSEYILFTDILKHINSKNKLFKLYFILFQKKNFDKLGNISLSDYLELLDKSELKNYIPLALKLFRLYQNAIDKKRYNLNYI